MQLQTVFPTKATTKSLTGCQLIGFMWKNVFFNKEEKKTFNRQKKMYANSFRRLYPSIPIFIPAHIKANQVESLVTLHELHLHIQSYIQAPRSSHMLVVVDCIAVSQQQLTTTFTFICNNCGWQLFFFNLLFSFQ